MTETKLCTICGHDGIDNANACERCGYALDAFSGADSTAVPEAGGEVYEKGRMIAGQYLVLKVLGAGGMGVVYLVENTLLGSRRREALKMIHGHLVDRPGAQALFEREVEICQEMVHEDIVRVYDLRGDGDRRFFTMEYVDGRTLRGLIHERGGAEKNGRFTLPETAAVIRPLLDVLAYAHQKTVHRDIKPENIMVLGDFPAPRIKVLDFGIAKAMSPSQFTRTAHVMGTAQYMSPEQMAGSADVDLRADLYAVGGVAYEMLTGRLAVGRGFPLPGELYPDLPRELDEAMDRAFAYDPDSRFQSAGEMKAALEEAVGRYEEMVREQEERTAKIEKELAAGASALEAGDFDRAAEASLRALEIDAENARAGSLKQAVEKARARREKCVADIDAAETAGNLDLALELLEKAEAAFPGFEAWEETRSRIREKIADNKRRDAIDALLKQAGQALDDYRWAEANRLFEEVLDLDRENAAARDGLGTARAKVREFKRLVDAAKKAEASERFGDAVSLVERAAALWSEKKGLGKWRARLASRYAEVLEQDREMARLLADAQKAADEADWYRAEQRLAEALRLRPDDREVPELLKAVENGREEARKQKRFAELVEEAKAADRDGNLADAFWILKEALLLRPDEQWIEVSLRELTARIEVESAQSKGSDASGEHWVLRHLEPIAMVAFCLMIVIGSWIFVPQIRQLFPPKPPPPAAEKKESVQPVSTVSRPNELTGKKVQMKVSLRSSPKTLSENDIKNILKRHGFYEFKWNERGDFINEFKDNGDGTITDQASRLMWQKSGSDKYIPFDNTEQYIAGLNRQRFAGYADWRLPTLEELWSLLENKEMNGELLIDPVFDKTQIECWSADQRLSDSEWVVDFHGAVYWVSLDDSNYVRAVRSVSSIQSPEIDSARNRDVQPALLDEKKDVLKQARLYLKTQPADAKIRIMNIKPRFYQGIELESGKYDIKVTAQGYETWEKTVHLSGGERKDLTVRLRKKDEAPDTRSDPSGGRDVAVETEDSDRKSEQSGADGESGVESMMANHQKRYAGEKIVADFYGTDIKNVFRMLREVSGKNFAVDKDVTGKVTLSFDRPVPWDQALDLILKMNQLGMTMEGDIIRIATLKTLGNERESTFQQSTEAEPAGNKKERKGSLQDHPAKLSEDGIWLTLGERQTDEVVLKKSAGSGSRRIGRTPLEKKELKDLKLVGIIKSDTGNKALIQDSNGKGYVASKGTRIGINSGIVVKIDSSTIHIEETLQNGETVIRKLALQEPIKN